MALETARIRALIFDVDGTLSDTDDQFIQKISRWLNPVRFAFPNRDPRPFARRFVMASETPANLLFGLPDRLGIDSQIARLDEALHELNKDYVAYRVGSISLGPPEVWPVRPGGFADWMRSKGKFGGQHKVPRMDNSGQLTAEIAAWLGMK